MFPRVEREEVPEHLGFEQVEHLRDGDDVAGGRRQRLAVEREPLVHHRHRRLDSEDVLGDVLAGGPRALGVVLAERLEVDAEDLPLAGHSKRHGSFPSRNVAVPSWPQPSMVWSPASTSSQTYSTSPASRSTAVTPSESPTLGTLGQERDVVVVDLVLILREHVTGPVGAFEHPARDCFELAVGVQLGVRDELHVDADQLGAFRRSAVKWAP